MDTSAEPANKSTSAPLPWPKPTIGICGGAQRLEDRCHWRAVQEHGQPVTVQQPGVGQSKLLAGIDIDWHHATLGGRCNVVQESDKRTGSDRDDTRGADWQALQGAITSRVILPGSPDYETV